MNISPVNYPLYPYKAYPVAKKNDIKICNPKDNLMPPILLPAKEMSCYNKDLVCVKNSEFSNLKPEEKSDIDYSVKEMKKAIISTKEAILGPHKGIYGIITRAYMQGMIDRYSNNPEAMRYVLQRGAVLSPDFGADIDKLYTIVFFEEFNKAQIDEPDKQNALLELLNTDFLSKRRHHAADCLLNLKLTNTLLDNVENYPEIAKSFLIGEFDGKSRFNKDEREDYALFGWRKIADRIRQGIKNCAENNIADKDEIEKMLSRNYNVLDYSLQRAQRAAYLKPQTN